MNIVRERQRITEETYCLDFYKNGELCAGYDTEDKVTPIFRSPEGEQNWNSLLELVKTGEYEGPVLNKYTNTYTAPAVGKCKCGEEFELIDEYMGACQCPKCNQWHNLFGQELLPPDRWEKNLGDYEDMW